MYCAQVPIFNSKANSHGSWLIDESSGHVGVVKPVSFASHSAQTEETLPIKHLSIVMIVKIA